MTTATREFAISEQTTLGFDRCLDFLRQSLARNGFHVVAELPFHRDFPRHIGVPAQKKYTVLVAWSPFLAYQALLSDPEAGLFMPFNFIVADDNDSTKVTCANHALFGRLIGTIGIRILARDLAQEIRKIFAELSARERVAATVSTQQERLEEP